MSSISTVETQVIEAKYGWRSLGLSEVWEHRELLYFLVWREVQGSYRQTALGLSWIFLRPVINMVLLSFVFGKLVQVNSDGLPYPLFSLAALLPWGYFSNAVTRASRSLVDNMHLISKVYFPRMIIPIAGAVSGTIDFAASMLVFFVTLFIYKLPLRIEMLLVPFLFVITLMFSLGVGFWLATLSVRYRDVSFAVNFLLQAMMYISPVIYSVSIIPKALRFIYYLNPMTGVIQGFRWALLGSGEGLGIYFLIEIIIVILLLISGAYIFRRTERTIVDVL